MYKLGEYVFKSSAALRKCLLQTSTTNQEIQVQEAGWLYRGKYNKRRRHPVCIQNSVKSKYAFPKQNKTREGVNYNRHPVF